MDRDTEQAVLHITSQAREMFDKLSVLRERGHKDQCNVFCQTFVVMMEEARTGLQQPEVQEVVETCILNLHAFLEANQVACLNHPMSRTLH